MEGRRKGERAKLVRRGRERDRRIYKGYTNIFSN